MWKENKKNPKKRAQPSMWEAKVRKNPKRKERYSLSMVRRSARERMSSREKREKETYKDKAQGSQPTLEKNLAKTPKMARN